MATFTRPNDTQITIGPSSVARARRTLRNEIDDNPGHEGCALFSPKQLVMETIDQVGPALQQDTPSFDKLHAPDGSEVWFDAKKAKDARAPLNSETSDNTKAVVTVGGTNQRVCETVADAQAVIDAARLR
ncbi:MAG: hypothetical protein AAF754_18885 [Pseudomonadota bacterium]